MTSPRSRCSAACTVILPAIFAAALVACGDTPTTASVADRIPGHPSATRTATALAVSSTDPAFGDQGTTIDVHVFGSGFSAGAQATWLLHGVADPNQVRTNGTTVVSSTELVANITIASDATLDFWDVQVALSNGKNGVGSDLFEVTTAIPIGTLGKNAEAHDASGSGLGALIVGWSYNSAGQRAFVWPDANDNMIDLGSGYANAIDVAGTTIAGSNGSQAAIWTLEPSGWIESALPVQAGTPESHANAIASASDGSALIIAGEEAVSSKHATLNRPMLWVAAAGSWTRTPLPLPRTGSDVMGAVQDVNARGQGVGGVQGGGLPTQGVFWDSLGVAHVLPGDGYHATGIDASGTVISGASDGTTTVAVYWTGQAMADGSRVWSGPYQLPGGCQRAVGVDDAGTIIGNRCQTSTNSRYTSAVWLPPYTTAIMLSGLGDQSEAGAAWGISRDGSRIVGAAPTGGGLQRIAVYWWAASF